MVKSRHLLIALFVFFILMTAVSNVTAQRVYRLKQEWVKIWINQDGTIDLFYNISITLESGNSIGMVAVGQPQPNFNITNAMDQNSHTLVTVDASYGDYYAVNVTLHSPLLAGQTVWFTLTTRVAHMIWEDTTNPGNVGMKFIPTWWEQASVYDLRILIVLPSGVNQSMVRTLEQVPWNGTQPEDDKLAIFFTKQNLLPNEQYLVGVSFPKQYVKKYDAQPTGLVAFFQQYGTALLTFGFFAAVIGAVVYVVRKKPYLIPKISMETLGIRRGLTAVEASYLLEMQPTKIVTEILYSLLQKRAIWVESTNPSLKLKVMQPFQDKHGTSETPLRYYEIDFLKALKEDGTLEEEKLAHTIMFLRDAVEQKMRGYCRRDTIDYYRKIVTKAWEQVQHAGTSELA